MHIRVVLFSMMSFFLNACAVLHHVQLGDVDASGRGISKKIDLKLSETGVNLQEAGAILRRLGNRTFSRQTRDAENILGLFQMGPRTGNLVYNADYARPIFELLFAECPSGKISNLALMRESRKYPVVSGEIIKVSGDCWQ
ncbi:MAG: hypothetical protein H7249_00640 [Chitinophagaceae bacterium]|nr:hypothetical protein [Oligoflexus sp.]